MDIFSVFSLAQEANPLAEVTIRGVGRHQVLITWQWQGKFLNRRYCKERIAQYRYGEFEGWKNALRAASEIMGQTAEAGN